MLRLFTAAFATAVAFAPLQATAQSVGIGIYPGAPYGYVDDDGVAVTYGPQVYGYYQEYEPPPAIGVRVPAARNGCGLYHYWDGTRCLDARFVPPDLE